jgi:hypothetical protein
VPAFAVIICPTWALPEIVGIDANAGTVRIGSLEIEPLVCLVGVVVPLTVFAAISSTRINLPACELWSSKVLLSVTEPSFMQPVKAWLGTVAWDEQEYHW